MTMCAFFSVVKSIVVIAIYCHTSGHMHANKLTCLLICRKTSIEGFSTIQKSISILTYCAIHNLHGRYSHADKADYETNAQDRYGKSKTWV